MVHDVFISFSSVNTDVAEKICAYLEASGEIKCWIAFRDIVPSANYAEQLVEAIESSKLLLLVLSDASNKSVQVAREVERAGSKGIPILPLRVEDVALSKAMEYFISSHHWLDAYESDIEEYLPALQSAVQSSILGKTSQKPADETAPGKMKKKLPARSNMPRYIFAAGVVITVLLLALVFIRSRQDASPAAGNAPPQSSVALDTGASSPGSSSRDALIQDLVRRYRENKGEGKKNAPAWSSTGPLSIAFLDVTGNGMRDAEVDFILNTVAEKLRESGRYAVVEREMIDKILQELNLSSSDLADPATSLKLGRILSADLIVTGSLARQGDEWLANLRFIETETTAVKCSVSALVEQGGPSALSAELQRGVAGKLRREYPLRARITSVSGETAVIDIGRRSGVMTGMIFTIDDGNYNGSGGKVTVASVDQGQSTVSPVGITGVLSAGTRLREQVGE